MSARRNSYTSHSPDSLEQSDLNFFQLASFQLKIRYNAGVSLPPTFDSATIANQWYRTVATHGAHCQVGLARLASDPTKARPLIVRQPLQNGGGKLNFAPPVVAPLQGRSLEELVAGNLYPAQDLPVTGPAVLYVFTNEQERAVALVVNVCAALWDGSTLKSVLQNFLKLLLTDKPPSTKDWYATNLGGWEKFIQEKANQTTPDPLFLPMGDSSDANIVGITDILSGPPAETLQDRRVTLVLDGETVGGLAKHVKGNITWTNLLGAVFVYALAEKYFKDHPDQSTITLIQCTLIDPRTMLDSSDKYIHCVGVLNHSTTVAKKDMESSLTDWLIQSAKRTHQDQQTRLERGEGLHRTLEVATGQIDPHHRVAPCLEMDDRGAMETFGFGEQIVMGHRMDICPHTSMGLHTEKERGRITALRVEAQMGREQGRESTLQWLERCAAICKEVAGEDDGYQPEIC